MKNMMMMIVISATILLAGFLIYVFVYKPARKIKEQGPERVIIHGIDTGYVIPNYTGLVRYRDKHGVWQKEYFQRWELTPIAK